jgi:hypothetical protein
VEITRVVVAVGEEEEEEKSETGPSAYLMPI